MLQNRIQTEMPLKIYFVKSSTNPCVKATWALSGEGFDGVYCSCFSLFSFGAQFRTNLQMRPFWYPLFMSFEPILASPSAHFGKELIF